MSALAALAVATGIVLIALGRRRAGISERVGRYLRPDFDHGDSQNPASVKPQALDAGLDWSNGELIVRRSAAAAAGALVGILVAQGDLLVEGPGRSVLPLALLGAAAGWLGFGMWVSTRRDRRAHRLRFELPVVADVLALNIVAGSSVATAVERYVAESSGVAADELRAVLDEVSEGRGIGEALQRGAGRTVDVEAGRLYTVLAHAHDTGGRLADALTDLGADYRAALARDLTAEGGRRALTTYAPVLALMVPVTLLFLLYPTLVGLRSLAGGP